MASYAVPGRLLAKDEAIKLVLSRYELSRRELVDPKRPQWKEWYDAYRSAMEIPEDTMTSQLAIPLIYSSVEDFTARLAVTPRVEVWGRGPEDALRANHHRQFIMYDWQLLNAPMKLLRLVKTAEVYGTSYLITTHRTAVERRLIRNKRLETIFDFFGQQIGGRMRDNFLWKEVEVWNDAWWDVPDTDTIYPDPRGRTFDRTDACRCRWFVREIPITLGQIKAARFDGRPLYDKSAVAELEEVLKSGNIKQNPNTETLKQHANSLFNETQMAALDVHDRECTLLEYWSDDQVITVVLELPQAVRPLRNAGNPYGHMPIQEFTPIPDLHSIMGLSIPEVLYSMQIELQTLHAAQMDNALYRVHQMYTILKNKGINPHDLRFSPSGVVWVSQHDHIRPLARDAADFSVVRMEQQIDRWAQKAMSTDTFSGLSAGGGTATEANILNEASGTKASLMLKILGWQCLGGAGKQLMRVNELNTSDNRFFRIAGDEFADRGLGVEERFERVTPEELVSGSGMDLDCTIDLAHGEPMTAQAKLQRAERFLGTAAQIQLPPDHPIVQAVLIEYARGTGLSANPENLVLGLGAEQALQQARLAKAPQTGQPEAPAQDVSSPAEVISAESGAELGGSFAN